MVVGSVIDGLGSQVLGAFALAFVARVGGILHAISNSRVHHLSLIFLILSGNPD